METRIYSIYDSAAQAFITPFFMHNDGMALRAFSDNVNAKEENNISKHPDQFTLFHIGNYDDQTGQIESIEPKSLGNGIEYVEPTQETNLDKKLDSIIAMLGGGHEAAKIEDIRKNLGDRKLHKPQ
jgi:hypothetical protein